MILQRGLKIGNNVEMKLGPSFQTLKKTLFSSPCHARWFVSKSSHFCGESVNIHSFVEAGLITNIDPNVIRNFSVIAHIDHGKSTLSDAILQLTGNISAKERSKGQILDSLKVERERGITVKAQTATMIFNDARTDTKYLINLIDTPGHIDFSYEVSRSLASCQGAILLVDSTQNVQAQTLANYEKARVLGLKIIPVVTKIDLPNAQPEDTALGYIITFLIF